MTRQMALAAGKPGVEDVLLSSQSDTEAYYGRLAKARDFTRRAVDSALRNISKETASQWQVNAAMCEVGFGNVIAAKQELSQALALGPSRNIRMYSALTLARVGETARATKIAEELENNYIDRFGSATSMLDKHVINTPIGAHGIHVERPTLSPTLFTLRLAVEPQVVVAFER